MIVETYSTEFNTTNEVKLLLSQRRQADASNQTPPIDETNSLHWRAGSKIIHKWEYILHRLV